MPSVSYTAFLAGRSKMTLGDAFPEIFFLSNNAIPTKLTKEVYKKGIVRYSGFAFYYVLKIENENLDRDETSRAERKRVFF